MRPPAGLVCKTRICGFVIFGRKENSLLWQKKKTGFPKTELGIRSWSCVGSPGKCSKSHPGQRRVEPRGCPQVFCCQALACRFGCRALLGQAVKGCVGGRSGLGGLRRELGCHCRDLPLSVLRDRAPLGPWSRQGVIEVTPRLKLEKNKVKQDLCR